MQSRFSIVSQNGGFERVYQVVSPVARKDQPQTMSDIGRHDHNESRVSDIFSSVIQTTL
jgi:hypothetical protein